MDAIASLIGAGLNFLGGSMNRSEQSKANDVNAQYAMWNMQGTMLPTYLANLRAGAEGAGFNPLAVLGLKGGVGAPQQVGGSDQSLSQAGSMIAQAGRQFDQKEIRDAQLEQMKWDTELKKLNSMNGQIEQAIKNWSLDQILAGRLLPAGVQEYSKDTTVAGHVIEEGKRRWPATPGIMLPGGTVPSGLPDIPTARWMWPDPKRWTSNPRKWWEELGTR